MINKYLAYFSISNTLLKNIAVILVVAIFFSERDEVTGEWRKLHNEEFHDLYSSPTIVWVIKSRRMRWAGPVARMGEERGAYRFWMGNLRERTTGENQV
jgi:hypothetical protein